MSTPSAADGASSTFLWSWDTVPPSTTLAVLPETPLTSPAEIVGTAIRVGPKVTLIKEGERVGVGAQSWSCLDCRQCKNDNETYCRQQLDTYGAVWPDTGIVSQGGYSSHVRTHEHW